MSFRYNVRYTATHETAEEGLRTLDPKKRGCLFKDESSNVDSHFHRYSQGACLWKSLVHLGIKTFNCSPWHLPLTPEEEKKIPICDGYLATMFEAFITGGVEQEDFYCLSSSRTFLHNNTQSQ